MAFIHVKIPLNFRACLFSVVAISWLTGSIFFILDTWITVEGDFGPEKHPWQQNFLMVHGASAFIMMVMYGAMLFSHLPSTWRLNRLRYLGLSLVISLGFQVVSAYILYYLANDVIRTVISNLHTAVGFCFPFLLTAHIVYGIRMAKELKATSLKTKSIRKSHGVKKKDASNRNPPIHQASPNLNQINSRN